MGADGRMFDVVSGCGEGLGSFVESKLESSSISFLSLEKRLYFAPYGVE